MKAQTKSAPAIQLPPFVAVFERVLRAVATKGAALDIKTALAGDVVVIEIKAAAADQGKLIGYGGRHIGALMRLATEMGQLAGRQVVVDLLEPDNSVNAIDDYEVLPADAVEKLFASVLNMIDPNIIYDAKHLETVTVFAVNGLAPDIAAMLGIIFDAVGFRNRRYIRITIKT